MLEMDGYEVRRQFKASAATPDIPIILFAARADRDDQLPGFGAWCCGLHHQTHEPADSAGAGLALKATADLCAIKCLS